MNRILFSFVFLTLSLHVFSQANYSVTDPEKDYKKAKEYFIKGDYALSYTILQSLLDKYPANTESSHSYINEDVQYYYIVTRLKLGQSWAEEEAKVFIDAEVNEPRQQMMSYHLAHYYFVNEDFARAAVYYERAGYENLTNDEIANAKFELGYSYLRMNQESKARPLFNEVHQVSTSKYYKDANYYYGYLSFKQRDYERALSSFRLVENTPEYGRKVPYYIAQIYYFQGHKEQALTYGENALRAGNIESRKEMNLLLGQIYYERKEFGKALPLLQNYVDNSDKVSTEVMYELAYCYYDANRVEQAIDAFKQLSNEKDSLGQNSMYLLGDLYLRTNQKSNARNAFQYSADNNSNRFQQEVSRFNYAKLSYELGYNDIALSSINQFLSLYPQSPYANEAKEILINLLANSNNFAEALRLYESFDKPTPTMQRIYTRILFGRAVELINNNQYAEANSLLEKVIKDPLPGKVLPFAHFWQGEIAYRQNRFNDAIQSLNKYLQYQAIDGEVTPDNARYTLGYSYLQTDNFPKAYENFNKIQPKLTASSTAMQQDAYVRAADALYMQKNYTTSKTMYQNVINMGLPQSDYSLYQLALIAGINNQPEKIKTFNRLIEQYPNSELVPEAYLQIANAYMAQERFRDAVPYLEKILTNKNATAFYPATYMKLGLAYYNMNNNTKALENYKALVEKYPRSDEADEAMVNLRAIYVELGRPNEYIDFAKKSGKNMSVTEADSLTFAAAQHRLNENDCSGAILALNNYLEKYPDGSYALDAIFYRSECYYRNSEFENAVRGYAQVVAAGPSRFAEQSALAAARIYYFETVNYDSSKVYFSKLLSLATSQENQLEALRGLTRSYYQTKDFSQANVAAQELLTRKGISTDDKSIANLVLGKSLQAKAQFADAIKAYKQTAATNKGAWGAEARYEIANCYFLQNNLTEAENAGMDAIKASGSDYWVAKSYILLGDIYLKQKDYFNAKATFKSVADNASIEEVKQEAARKLERTIEEEKLSSKVESSNPEEN
ncbi:MAG: tetratricopeptide repeat protein [Chitinophagaceae bacterium]|nr:tetratricopeptide repeat protein [Chitinophagaceae bacterium]